jgi:hypothetical protein
VIATGGLLNGVVAPFNTCLISDSNVEYIDPPIDQITSLCAGQVVQCTPNGWVPLFARTPGLIPRRRIDFDCVDFNQILAYLPSNSAPDGFDPFPNLFLGYYPPPQFQDPQSIRFREQFAAQQDKTLYLQFSRGGGSQTYYGTVEMDTSNSWSGVNEYDGITVTTTYTYTLAPA